MKKNSYSAMTEARDERLREQRAAGLVSDRFPRVSSIVVTMSYRRPRSTSLLRTVSFFPGSPAYFRITCLGEGCERGGLDLTWVINRMVGESDRSTKGKLSCENRDPAVRHAAVDYDVAITYL